MSEWKEVTIGEIAEVKTGPFGSALLNEQYIQGGTPVITVEHIKDFRISQLDYPSVTDEDKDRLSSYTLEEGDIVFSRVGSVDLSAIALKENIGWLFSSRMLRVRPDRKLIDPLYLSYYLRLYGVRKYINNIAVGSTMPSINTQILKSIPVIHCELSEQKEIAKALSSLDQKITLLQEQNQTLEELAQTLFKRWFVEFEFPISEEQAAAMGNPDLVGQPYKSSSGKMTASELGEIPEGWTLSTIGENVETLGGGTPSTQEPAYWENGEIFWYSPTDLTKSNSMFSNSSSKKISELGLQKSSAKLFPAYSILMTSRATVGEITINTSEACTNQGFITLIPNEKISLFFLYDWLKTKLSTVHNLASGSTFPEISKTDFRNMEVLIGTSQIHQHFDESMKPIFKSIENNTNEIQSLTELRDTLLPKLMSGELRPNII
ncbi:restriction endonuclease subunit S [Echinicola marina]|uniref:restriction endonuclease subunit S n=1 Tax=Echinicola marina TaxID=2859768 RepID=UPI001CF68C46|nr:restriction endonuclease subunit S [Echinicola marina]UCS93772.1 restriction endonuclease subunit S [Echinicola marina]